MSAAPPLTVLLPVYDAAEHVGAAIASVLDQSFGDFELLVIDDGSTDESLEVVRDFSDKRIRVETQPENRGLIATLNAGIAMARGALLARMDADDLSYPGRLALQVAHLGAHPDVAGVSGGFDIIDAHGERLAEDYGWFRPTDPLVLRWALHFGCVFTHAAAMLRTAVLRAAGGFDPRYVHAEDYELWLRLVDGHRLANVPDVLLAVRKHGANVSTRHFAVQRASAHRALHGALERQLARPVELALAAHVYEGTLPAAPSDTRAVARLHGEILRAVARDARPHQRRAMAADLAERLGVLAARALRSQPWTTPLLAAIGARHGAAAFARGFAHCRRGDRR